MDKLTIPTIHLNGSSREHLTAALEKAGTALHAAVAALNETAPHGRDYYPQADPMALSKATKEHVRRLARVQDVLEEIQSIHEEICGY